MMQDDHQQISTEGSGAGCGCGPAAPTRRDFLTAIGLTAVGALTSRLAVAGPFETADFQTLVPADKKLSADWIKSLFDRGTPTIYRGADLKYIGMPVGGITTGQLYLGGDGKLWHWDIFNQHIVTSGEHYADPPAPDFPLQQGFSLKIGDQSRDLDTKDFADVTFSGQYPIGTVNYTDPACPLAITLEAFSPFIPLNVDDSSLPATVMRFTLHNASTAPVDAELTGMVENAVCLHHRNLPGTRRNRVVAGEGFTFLECTVEKAGDSPEPARPDIVFEDWNKDTYAGWTVEGTAFGAGPIKKSAIPDYQGDVGGDTDRVINSHASAPGDDVDTRDNATGKLTSSPFKIDRKFIRFWIGGGAHEGKTCLNLLVDGKVVHMPPVPTTTRWRLTNSMFNILKAKKPTSRLSTPSKARGETLAWARSHSPIERQ